MSARRPAWQALPDAVGVAGQWRPADLRGLPATLRYGASLSGVALAAARGRPRKVVVIDACGPVFGADFEAAVDGVAGTMAAAVRRANRREVAVYCGAHRGFLAAVTAAGALGVDAVVVPPDSGTDMVREALSNTDVVVVDETTQAKASQEAPHATLIHVLPHAGSSAPGRSLRTVPRPRHPGGLRMLTTDTTGQPHATKRSPAALGQLATLLSLIRAIDLRRDEPVVIAPALAHGHGLSVLTAALVVGAPAVLANGRGGADLAAFIRDHDAGVLAAAPTQLSRLLDTAPELPTLRRVATGSAPLTPQLWQRCHDVLDVEIVDFYGSSELGTATIASPQDLREAPSTVGRPAPGVTFAVVHADGEPVASGAVGDAVIQSPWRASSSSQGPAVVGDMGHLDDQGRLFIAGRADDLVAIGEHNVSTTNVRKWFAQQPGVSSAVVEVLLHPDLGHELRIVITGDADLDDLRERSRTELGSAAAPRRIERT